MVKGGDCYVSLKRISEQRQCDQSIICHNKNEHCVLLFILLLGMCMYMGKISECMRQTSPKLSHTCQEN